MKLDRIWTSIPITLTLLLAGTGLSYGAEKVITAGGSKSDACGYVPQSAHQTYIGDFSDLRIEVSSLDGGPLPKSTVLLIEGPGQSACLPVNDAGKIEDSGLYSGTYRFSVGDRNSTTGSRVKLSIVEQ